MSVFFMTLIYGIVSGNISKNYKRKQEGKRLYIALNIQFKNEVLYQDIGFRYFTFRLYLGGALENYREFISKRGYVEVDYNVYCKNKNLIHLYQGDENIELKYEHESNVCN